MPFYRAEDVRKGVDFSFTKPCSVYFPLTPLKIAWNSLTIIFTVEAFQDQFKCHLLQKYHSLSSTEHYDTL